MTLSMRIVGPLLASLRANRSAALRDPSVLKMLVRERTRLQRALAASAPDLPRLNPVDRMLLTALEELHGRPLEAIVEGAAVPGSFVHGARLRMDNGFPVVEVGAAQVDEWGGLRFSDLVAYAPSPAPAPLALAS